MRRIPTFVHESNAIPGKANRLNARMVDCVLLGFAECARFLPDRRCEVTGTPIRQNLSNPLPKGDALAAFQLSGEGRRTILVMGGSQGARGINDVMISVLSKLREAAVQVIHLAGPTDEAKLRDAYSEAGIPAWVAPFHHQMEEAYSAADLAIARSGAASLTELSHFALPSVLIPYPHAAEDHQTLNAEIFEKAGAAILIPERGAAGGEFGNRLLELLGQPDRLRAMSERSASLAPSQAAERVAETILKYCSPQVGSVA